MVPSSLLGILAMILGVIALWSIRRHGGENRDRFFAIGGIVIGFVPIISLCITTVLIIREIPRWVEFLSGKWFEFVAFISLESHRLLVLLSNLFR